MNYKKIVDKEYNIHLIHNKGFHTIDFSVYFTENVSKEIITYRNALIDILTYSTKNYNTNNKLMRKCQELYSIRPTANIVRYGNLLSTKFNISIINSKYVSQDNIKENILLLQEIILNPFVFDNHFDDIVLEIIKKSLRNETVSIQEEPRVYANVHLLELMDNDANYALTGYSDLEILDKMNSYNLYESYLKMLKNSKIDIFISGDFTNDEELIKTIEENFIFNKEKENLSSAITYHQIKRSIPKKYNIKKNYQQSKLAIGLKLYDLSEYESKYVLPVFNNIFGGGSDSLLMRNIREDNSLCYYVNSYFNKLDNILVINSGINKENYEKVLDLIQKAISKIQDGLFSELDIKKAKMEILINIDNLKENNRNLIEYHYGLDVFKSDELKKKKEMIKSVSKNEIKEITSKINIDTIFFLEGEL